MTGKRNEGHAVVLHAVVCEVLVFWRGVGGREGDATDMMERTGRRRTNCGMGMRSRKSALSRRLVVGLVYRVVVVEAIGGIGAKTGWILQEKHGGTEEEKKCSAVVGSSEQTKKTTNRGGC